MKAKLLNKLINIVARLQHYDEFTVDQAIAELKELIGNVEGE